MIIGSEKRISEKLRQVVGFIEQFTGELENTNTSLRCLVLEVRVEFAFMANVDYVKEKRNKLTAGEVIADAEQKRFVVFKLLGISFFFTCRVFKKV